jgi:hypothetical protein
MTLPDNWDFSIRGIIKITREGIDAIKSTIRELRDYGYCTMDKRVNDKGQYTKFAYTFYEECQCPQKAQNPQAENPLVENPLVENQTQYNNIYNINNNNNVNNIIYKERKRDINKLISSKERNEDEDDVAKCNEKSEVVSKEDIEWFIKYWNEKLPSQQIRLFTYKRKMKLLVRAKEMKEGGGDILRQLSNIVDEIAQSRFLQGDNPRGFKATIDWVLENSNNYIKILEGNYRDAKPTNQQTTGTTSGEYSQEQLRENIARRLLGVNN